MSENILQLINLFKLILLAGYAALYGYGGISGKWKRRFVAPAVLTAGIAGLSLWSGQFSYWFLGYLPLLSAALHLGYGSDNFYVKLRKRAIYGLAIGVSCLPVAIGSGMWALFGLQIFTAILTCIILGVFNITRSARAEETIMAAAGSIFVLGMFG